MASHLPGTHPWLLLFFSSAIPTCKFPLPVSLSPVPPDPNVYPTDASKGHAQVKFSPCSTSRTSPVASPSHSRLLLPSPLSNQESSAVNSISWLSPTMSGFPPTPDHQGPFEPTSPSAFSPISPFPLLPFQALLQLERLLPNTFSPVKHSPWRKIFEWLPLVLKTKSKALHVRDSSRSAQLISHTSRSAPRHGSASLSLRSRASSPWHAFPPLFLRLILPD